MATILYHCVQDGSPPHILGLLRSERSHKALGVVALVKPDGGCVLKEYPADWHEFSVWREGDEGEFYGLDVDFATIEHGNLTLYTVTEGEEGASYQNFVVKGDSLVEGSISNYFYHAPD